MSKEKKSVLKLIKLLENSSQKEKILYDHIYQLEGYIMNLEACIDSNGDTLNAAMLDPISGEQVEEDNHQKLWTMEDIMDSAVDMKKKKNEENKKNKGKRRKKNT